MAHRLLILIGAILLISIGTSKAQKQRLDTVYYNASGDLVDKSSDYLTYEIRSLDRKKRVVGVTGKFTKTGRLLEATTYDKGVKTGPYERFHPNGTLMLYGDNQNGERFGFWALLNPEGDVLTIQEYSGDGELIQTRNRPHKLEKSLTFNDSLLLVVEEPPRFPGGPEAWSRHLSDNLKYPTEAKRYGHQGKVRISFVVLSDGTIVIPRVLDSPHSSLSKESLRMLLISPNWNPGRLNGKPIDMESNISVVYRLKTSPSGFR